jgi:hypothetical protein
MIGTTGRVIATRVSAATAATVIHRRVVIRGNRIAEAPCLALTLAAALPSRSFLPGIVPGSLGSGDPLREQP